MILLILSCSSHGTFDLGCRNRRDVVAYPDSAERIPETGAGTEANGVLETEANSHLIRIVSRTHCCTLLQLQLYCLLSVGK